MKIVNESLEVHDILNPKIWNPDDGTLRVEVKNKIKEIVDEFINYVKEDGISLDVVDTHILGSNASYNYTDESDLDVHLVVNFEMIDASKEILQILFNSERSAFNKTYDISIHGIEVEMYVEDIKATTISNGIYSLNKNAWIKYPTPIEYEDDGTDIDSQVEDYIERIDEVLDSDSSAEVKSMINELYLLRKDSLDTEGEYGIGNQIFKEIRSLGLIDDLKDRLNELISDELSLESLMKESFKMRLKLTEDKKSELISKINEIYDKVSTSNDNESERVQSSIDELLDEYEVVEETDWNEVSEADVEDIYNKVQSFLRTTGLKEAKVSSESVLDDIWSVIKEYALSEGFEEDEVDKYFFATKNIDEENPEYIIFEVRAEVGFDGLMELADMLNPIIEKIDKESYFDAVDPGVLQAYVSDSALTEGCGSKEKKESYIVGITNDGVRKFYNGTDWSDSKGDAKIYSDRDEVMDTWNKITFKGNAKKTKDSGFRRVMISESISSNSINALEEISMDILEATYTGDYSRATKLFDKYKEVLRNERIESLELKESLVDAEEESVEESTDQVLSTAFEDACYCIENEISKDDWKEKYLKGLEITDDDIKEIWELAQDYCEE